MKNTARVLILLLTLAVAAACSSGGKTIPEEKKALPQGGMVSAMAKMGNLATDPSAQMSFEFEGNPPKEQIREQIDKALAMYSLEANNQNRGNAGRILVALRKQDGHSEMAILEKMLNSPAEGKFDDAAAKISAAMNQ